MRRQLDRGLVRVGALCLAVVAVSACTVTSTQVGSDGGTNADGGALADGGSSNPDGSALPDSGKPAKDGAAAGPLGFTPSNIDLTGIDLTTVGDFVVDSDSCTINSESNLASCGDGATVLGFKLATQTDGTKVGVYVARTISIQAAQNLTVQGAFPIVLVALDTIMIGGTFNANSHEEVGIAGGASQGNAGLKGGGLGGGGAGTALGAGGGGSYCGIGGAGGTEIVDGGASSPGGPAYGTASIIPLVGGSSGGGGSLDSAGSGGGAVQLVAGTSITIATGGLIQVGAGGGGFGGISTQEANGGGSGGSILLESPTITVAGTLAANGGGGGGGTSSGLPSGANATGDATAAAGGSPGVSAGGNGSAGANINGGAGGFTDGNAAGGGGGGAGRIRLNTKLGSATITGVLSPAATTTCATQGTLQ